MRIYATFLAAVAAAVMLAGRADAGPFRRSVTTTRASTCTGGSCSTASTRTISRGGAEQHAQAMAARGQLVHATSHPGFEGVGTGPTAEAALASCCTNGGEIVDQGVARSASGRWFACVRRR